jgi:hypothetical protein
MEALGTQRLPSRYVTPATHPLLTLRGVLGSRGATRAGSSPVSRIFMNNKAMWCLICVPGERGAYAGLAGGE